MTKTNQNSNIVIPIMAVLLLLMVLATVAQSMVLGMAEKTVNRLRDDNSKLRAIIYSVEWAGSATGARYKQSCPYCLHPAPHDPNCAIGKVILDHELATRAILKK